MANKLVPNVTANDDVHPLENADLSKLPDELKERLDIARIETILKKAAHLNILVTGRTGTGKSTLINGLLGMKMEDKDDWALESTVTEGCGQVRLKAHSKKKGRYKVTVWDSRGLLDGADPQEQAKSLEEMVKECSEVDLKLLCINMNQRRFIPSSEHNSDIKAMKKLTETFKKNKKNFWKNSMIVLTFANKVKFRSGRDMTEQQQAEMGLFTRRLQIWEERIRNAIVIAGASEEEAKRINIVPAGHYDNRRLPDREYWLSHLWFECLDAMPSPEAQGTFLSINIERIHLASEVSENVFYQPSHNQPIVIEDEKVTKIKETANIVGFAVGGATTGASIALCTLVGGPIAVAVGVPAGAILGFGVGLALGIKRVLDEKEQKKEADQRAPDQHRYLCQELSSTSATTLDDDYVSI